MDIDRLRRLALAALEGAAAQDAEFRSWIMSTAREVLARLERGDDSAPPATGAASKADAGTDSAPLEDLAISTTPPASREVARLIEATLRLGDAVSGLQVRADADEESARTAIPTRGPNVITPLYPSYPAVDPDADFELIARRCRIKAAALRWQVEREAMLTNASDQGIDEIGSRDRAMIDAGKSEPDCFLWMCNSSFHEIDSDPDFERAACCYGALAEAATLMEQADREAAGEHIDFVAAAMRLLGEAQSALRIVAESAGLSRADPDQIMAFTWLRRETSLRGVYVQHLQIAAPADPSAHADLVQRISDVRQKVQLRQQETVRRRTLLKKADYHATRLANGDGDEGDWKRVLTVVEELVSECGLPPSDRDLRALLLPLMDDLPGIEVGSGTSDALAAVDRYLQQIADNPAHPAPHRAVSPALIEARRLLAGRTVLLIGGQARELHRRNIEASLHLAHLEWIPVQHHQSLEGEVRAALQRPEVSVVMTMTRFRSHAFGPQLRGWSREYGKVFVELPGGYGIEQIAHQVIQQADQELRASSVATP